MIGLEGDALTRYIMQGIERHDRHVERLEKKKKKKEKKEEMERLVRKEEADRIARER